MVEDATNSSDLLLRVASLEAHLSRVRRFLFATALACVIAIAATVAMIYNRHVDNSPQTSTQEIKARHFVAVDANGAERAILGVNEGGVALLSLLREDGRRAVQLAVAPDGLASVSIYDAATKASLSLWLGSDSLPALGISDSDGRSRIQLRLESTGQPSLNVFDAAGNYRGVLSMLPDGSPALRLGDSTRTIRTALLVQPDNTPLLVFFDGDRRKRALVGLAASGDAAVALLNDTGSREATLSLPPDGRLPAWTMSDTKRPPEGPQGSAASRRQAHQNTGQQGVPSSLADAASIQAEFSESWFLPTALTGYTKRFVYPLGKEASGRTSIDLERVTKANTADEITELEVTTCHGLSDLGVSCALSSHRETYEINRRIKTVFRIRSEGKFMGTKTSGSQRQQLFTWPMHPGDSWTDTNADGESVRRTVVGRQRVTLPDGQSLDTMAVRVETPKLKASEYYADGTGLVGVRGILPTTGREEWITFCEKTTFEPLDK